jgi:outer membrane protein assembly factor BamB
MSGVRRGALIAVGTVVALVLLAVVGVRAFAPKDSVQLARTPYPALPQVQPVLYAQLLRTPLLVDGRLRVYGAQREVWAEQPATAKSSLTPYWSLRRWPAQLLGVVAVGTTVVSLWSDGRLFGTDAHTGATLWHRSVSVGDGESYTGRRTGAATVYNPPHLTTLGALVVVGGGGARTTLALDAATGGDRWSAGSCAGTLFSTADLVVCAGGSAWTGAGAPAAVGVPAGAQPFACGPASAGCAGYRAGGQAWLLPGTAAATPAPALAAAGSWLVGDVVVGGQPDGTITGTALADGRELWRWTDHPPATHTRPAAQHSAPLVTEVIAAQDGVVHLLTPERDLITLDAATGAQRSRFSLVTTDTRAFAVGHVYAAGGFVFIERLRTSAQPRDADPAYYFPNPGVLAAGS